MATPQMTANATASPMATSGPSPNPPDFLSDDPGNASAVVYVASAKAMPVLSQSAALRVELSGFRTLEVIVFQLEIKFC